VQEAKPNWWHKPYLLDHSWLDIDVVQKPVLVGRVTESGEEERKLRGIERGNGMILR